jgi:hypothetical protein
LKYFAFILLLCCCYLSHAQEYSTLRGYVTDAQAVPLQGVYVRATQLGVGTVTNEKGQYELRLPDGLNRISFSYMGYIPQYVDLIIKPKITQNIILELTDTELGAVQVSNKKKDLSYEIIQKTIDRKEIYSNKFTTQKRSIYVKSVEENSVSGPKKEKQRKDEPEDDDPFELADSIPKLNLFEGNFVQHIKPPSGFKEEKIAAKKLGNQQTLFFTSTTDADFDFYQNLITSKRLGDNAYTSPLSTTAMLAYKYKLLGSRFEGDLKVYTIRVTPRKMGNALFSGEIEIWDSLFTLKSVNLDVSKNSLILYDAFRIAQEYTFVNNRRVLITERLEWQIKNGMSKSTGRCDVRYTNYRFDSTYAKKYFNDEVGITSDDAYEKDTSFWALLRPIPLTQNERIFMNYQDSIQRVRLSKHYLDSVDSVFNKPTVLKILWTGYSFINREKKTLWNFNPAIGLIDPVAIGGFRLRYSVTYYKKYENYKTLYIAPFLNYGFRNGDLKGNLGIRYLYNPKKQSTISLNAGKYFGFVNNFATIRDIFNRNNFYEENYLVLNHSNEILNGLYLNAGLRNTLRKDLGDFKFNTDFDSAFVNNTPYTFATHSAFEATIGVSYTPKQLYIQEPRQKIILGSKYPTFSLVYRQALTGIWRSSTKYKSLDFGINQKFNIGIFGTSEYAVNLGGFLDTSRLRIMDYRYQRGGDPILLIPPMYGYQLIDSTFATFQTVLEGHYLHDFNGFITSKIPGIKQLGIKTTIGGGILFVPERSYQYSEVLVGANRIFKLGRERLKLGVYYVLARSNTQGLTSGFKFSLNPYNANTSTWSF